MDAPDVCANDAFESSASDVDATCDRPTFPPFAVALNIVLLTLVGGSLYVLLSRRVEQPSRGRPTLQGVFVGIDEELDAAAARAVQMKAGSDVPVRRFGDFGGVNRTPRMRIVSVGYLALITADQLGAVLDEDHQLLRLEGGIARGSNGRRQALPFDHADVVAAAVAALRADLDASPFSFGLHHPNSACASSTSGMTRCGVAASTSPRSASA